MASGPEKAYAIAGDHVLAKAFEDELTLVNLDTGDYFAAGGIAVDLWTALAASMTIAALEQTIAGHYDATRDQVKNEVDKLVGAFLTHGLVTETLFTETGANPASSPSEPASILKAWPDSWFEIYGDMKELLLLDPVHDVDAGAWPPAPKPATR